MRRCKPKKDEGCGQEKPLEEFIDRVRYNGEGEPCISYRSWCRGCYNAKRRVADNRRRDDAARYRYIYDKTKQKYRCFCGKYTIAMLETEDKARELINSLSQYHVVYNKFSRLKPTQPAKYATGGLTL